MNRRDGDLSEAIGTDAFLDIVANLVGILLILIMVIGVRMDDASDMSQQNTAQPAVSVNEAESGIALAEPSDAETASPDDQTANRMADQADRLASNNEMFATDPFQSDPFAKAVPEIMPPANIPDPEPLRAEAARLKHGIEDAQRELNRIEQLTKLQQLDRDNLMVAVTHAETELDRRREKLDAQQQRQLQLQLEAETTREKFKRLTEQIQSLEQAAEQQSPEVLQHLATPIAETVFVREEHFRLKDNKLIYVPLNSMTDLLKREAPNKVWKLKTADQITEQIGPQAGFMLRYTLRRNRVPVQTDLGVAAREVVELERFVMIPIVETDGETVEESMNANSDLQSRLRGWDPNSTIVTVWTYPDSFAEFRRLKAALYEQGFLTAARPIPDGQLISGSPDGTRSAAQ